MTREGEQTPADAAEFQVTTESSNGVAVVRVVGELDLSTHEQLHEQLVGAAGEEPVVVDLSKCKFIDSSGIRALLLGYEAIKTGGGGTGRVLIAGAQPQVLRVLEMTGVDDAIPLHASVDEALGSL